LIVKLSTFVSISLALACGTFSALAQWSKDVELYQWVDFSIEAPGAAVGLARWDAQGSCTWTHANGVDRRTSTLWYSGSGDTYVYRFGGSLPGRWTGTTTSPVAALDGLELTVDVRPATNPNRTGWSGQLANKPTAWSRQQGPDGQLVQRTPILIMMPNVQSWHDDLAAMRAFVAEFNENHGFNGGHLATIGRAWFEANSTGNLRTAPSAPDVRTFAALEAAAAEWSERGGWLHLWMWGKGSGGDFDSLPGGHDGIESRRINRYVAARLGPVPGWSMGIGWDVEFCWLSASPGRDCPVSGLYKNHGLTWRNRFVGYSESQLLTLPRVTTETGYPVGGEVTEEVQARLFMNLYLSQFKRGWSHTAIYLLRRRANLFER
jgi:hypothetical protein